MSFTQDFIKKYTGKVVCFPEGSYCGECLSLVKVFIQERFGIYPPPSGANSAYGYWTNFPSPLGTVLKKVANTPDLIPKEGWIAVWNNKVGNGYGHISIVADDNSNQNTFNSFDANWGSKQAQKIVHNYNNIYGFLVPLKEDNMSDYEEAIRKSVAYDEVCKVLGVPSSTSKDEMSSKLSKLLSDKERYQKERNEARSERDNYAKENTGLNNQIALLKKDIAGLNEDLEKCKNEIPETGDLEKDWQATGRKIIKKTGDTIVETSYKRKE